MTTESKARALPWTRWGVTPQTHFSSLKEPA
jgi:hypothetical protein